jgi:catechol 2,3-dioxygenase
MPDTQPQPTAPATIHPEARIGHVHLKVADLDRALAFWHGVLGLEVMQRMGDQAAFLSAGGYHHHIALNTWESAGGPPPPRGTTGLYHVALVYPDRQALAAALLRVIQAGIELEGASDHGVSEAIYLPDPDGNGIELYADRPRDAWPPPSGPDERVGMFTRALDVHDLLATIEGEEPVRHAGDGLRMGHMHLHVGDIEAARAFYADRLGFEVMVGMPSALFLAAGGYHHHLGVNTWRGEGVGPAPAGTVGLREWTVILEPADLEAVRARLGTDVVEDPWGMRLRFAAA